MCGNLFAMILTLEARLLYNKLCSNVESPSPPPSFDRGGYKSISGYQGLEAILLGKGST